MPQRAAPRSPARDMQRFSETRPRHWYLRSCGRPTASLALSRRDPAVRRKANPGAPANPLGPAPVVAKLSAVAARPPATIRRFAGCLASPPAGAPAFLEYQSRQDPDNLGEVLLSP